MSELQSEPEPIRGCVPLRLREPVALGGARMALIESGLNRPWPDIVEAIVDWRRDAPSRQAAVSIVGKTWRPGSIIGVRFMDGTQTQRAKCQRWAETWLEYANLEFRWGVQQGEIQVSFRPGMSYSLLGTDALSVRHGPTLQLGWVNDRSDDESDRAVIVHEFGHALGLGHEQSHPLSDIQWNKPVAERYYRLTQGWDVQTVEVNVFQLYGTHQVETTAYDRDSIMQYPVPAELTTDGRGIGWNTHISELDKQHIATIYAGKWIPPSSAGPTAPEWPPADFVAPLDLSGETARAAAVPGQPARFAVQVVHPTRIRLSFQVGDAYGANPLVVGKTPEGPAFMIALQNGTATLDFQPGQYELAVYHPTPSVAVRAGAKAETLPIV